MCLDKYPQKMMMARRNIVPFGLVIRVYFQNSLRLQLVKVRLSRSLGICTLTIMNTLYTPNIGLTPLQ